MDAQRLISILILQLCCGCYTEKIDNYRVTTQSYTGQPSVNYSPSSLKEENKTMSLELILPFSDSSSNYSSNESSTETSLSKDENGIIQTNSTLHLSKNTFTEVVIEEKTEETPSLPSHNTAKNLKTNNVLTGTKKLTRNLTKYSNKQDTDQRMLLKSSDETSERTKTTLMIIKRTSTLKSTSFPSKNIKHGDISGINSLLAKSNHENSITTKPRGHLEVFIHVFILEKQQHDKPNKYLNDNVTQSPDLNSNEIYHKNVDQRSPSIENSTITVSRLTTVQPVTTNRILHKTTNRLINRFRSFFSTQKDFLNPSTKDVENYLLKNKPSHSTLSSRTALQKTTHPNWKIRDPSLESNIFEKVCDFDKDEGFGSDSFSSWYFNTKSGKCEWFSYRGDGGNGNRFYHRANCENSCIDKHENICLKSEIVDCVESWLQCKIKSDLSCEHYAKMKNINASLHCPPKQPICVNDKLKIRKSPVYLSHLSLIPIDCFLPKDSGACHQDSSSPLVYYYDPTINDCLGFLHSKCGGNVNRFFSKPDCMNRCAI